MFPLLLHLVISCLLHGKITLNLYRQTKVQVCTARLSSKSQWQWKEKSWWQLCRTRTSMRVPVLCATHSQHSISFSLLWNEQNQILFLFKDILNLYSPHAPPHNLWSGKAKISPPHHWGQQQHTNFRKSPESSVTFSHGDIRSAFKKANLQCCHIVLIYLSGKLYKYII